MDGWVMCDQGLFRVGGGEAVQRKGRLNFLSLSLSLGDFQGFFTKGNVARLTHAAGVEENLRAMDEAARKVETGA